MCIHFWRNVRNMNVTEKGLKLSELKIFSLENVVLKICMRKKYTFLQQLKIYGPKNFPEGQN